MGRNSTANPSVFSPTPEGKDGIPWVWEQFRGHGYATGISMEGCWCGETEDFFRSYPYGIFFIRLFVYSFIHLFIYEDI
jgi:hypothetical protein